MNRISEKEITDYLFSEAGVVTTPSNTASFTPEQLHKEACQEKDMLKAAILCGKACAVLEKTTKYPHLPPASDTWKTFRLDEAKFCLSAAEDNSRTLLDKIHLVYRAAHLLDDNEQSISKRLSTAQSLLAAKAWESIGDLIAVWKDEVPIGVYRYENNVSVSAEFYEKSAYCLRNAIDFPLSNSTPSQSNIDQERIRVLQKTITQLEQIPITLANHQASADLYHRIANASQLMFNVYTTRGKEKSQECAQIKKQIIEYRKKSGQEYVKAYKDHPKMPLLAFKAAQNFNECALHQDSDTKKLKYLEEASKWADNYLTRIGATWHDQKNDQGRVAFSICDEFKNKKNELIKNL